MLAIKQPVVQFSRGEYAGATNTQDDFAVITANGLSYRADEAGSTEYIRRAIADAGLKLRRAGRERDREDLVRRAASLFELLELHIERLANG